MMGLNKFFTTIAIGTLMLAGCTGLSHRFGVQGGDVTVIPVTYTYTVSVKNQKNKLAKQELFTYLKQNKNNLLIYGAQISWKGEAGKKLAKDASVWLISAGTPNELVTLSPASSHASNMVALSTTVYQVQPRVCNERIIGQYHSGDDGCYSDNLRWQAMLHPDRKLAGQSRTAILTKNSQ